MIRVGIADDNQEMVELIRQHLAVQEDMEVVCVAYNGESCLEKLEQIETDVLLLDIIMPHLDGLGVLEALAKHKNSPAVIMLSAFGKDEVSQQAVSLGAAYFLLKPFSLDQLVNKIRLVVHGVQTNQVEPVESKVGTTLREIGIAPHIKGFTYLKDAVLMVLEREDLLGLITKELYPMIAKKHQTTSSRVERAMRHAIKSAWKEGMSEHVLFTGRIEQQKGPKNSEFISYVSNHMNGS
ncbi:MULTISPECIES: sporulation transcription factor Spo0A [Exiguobacterium]|uniref:Stage 0 sporulation protein A homolog n=1 Tax=Exiguobacterium antarcticum TaxID=132920 RepID=A0ABT6R4W7_9BACL|nr:MULTISPECIES: sporulation transcription factor Spo0A [Exiguobacterium]MCT4780053.1 sporulation transcription factor Spo0A [Exiguobacterium soli]MDI3235319.1 sporulation transcription factor Spo0A [Exiguobacterium antarcticum]